MSSRAIMQFGEMLTKSTDIHTVGAGGPIFAWAAPGDIVICGEAPEDFHGRVCSVKFPDEDTPLLCRLYKDGENVRVGYMDDYDIWKSYPADAVTIRYEVLAVVHQYGPMEPPKAATEWEERVRQAAGDALEKFSFEDYAQLVKNDGLIVTHSQRGSHNVHGIRIERYQLPQGYQTKIDG